MQCSIKTNEEFYITDEMTINDFREKLNHLNSVVNSANVLETIDAIRNTFFITTKTNQ